MKILVTGSTGFIGHHLVKHFVDAGHDVYGIWRSNLKNQIDGCTYLHADLSVDELEPDQYDCVFHAAGQVENGKTWDYIRNSILSTKRLIEYCEKYGTKKMVFFSSIAVYGETKGVVNEKTSGTNLNLYAHCKLLCEGLLNDSTLPMKYVVRLSRIIGDGGFESGGFLSSFSRQMVKNERVIYSNGDVLYNNLFYISDLVNLCDVLLKLQESELCIGTGADEPITLEELVNVLKTEIGSQSVLEATKADKPLTCHQINIDQLKKFGIQPMSVKESLHYFAEDAKRRYE